MTDFLALKGRPILVCGLANRKSVAFHAANVLAQAGAELLLAVRSEKRAETAKKLFPESSVFVCDVEEQEQIEKLAGDVQARFGQIHGLVHSIAFADYSAGWQPFHKTPRGAFLQAVDISCFSLVALSNAFSGLIDHEHGSVVAVSISSTQMAAENYGFMAPVKAALDSSVTFLAKSFSEFSRVRFNAVCPGLLKTSASAGIPGYVDSYLFAERATLRNEALRTEEVANTIAFLLSPKSSGINAQGVVLDAGMGVNYFDKRLVESAIGS